MLPSTAPILHLKEVSTQASVLERKSGAADFFQYFTQRPSRAWMGSFSAGFSWAPELHVGWLAQGRISRLLSGSASSLTGPDLYAFVGGSVISIHGNSAFLFKDELPDLGDVLGQLTGQEPDATFGALQLGLVERPR